VLWSFSSLRFQAEMAQLLVDPHGDQHARRDHHGASLYSIFRPATAMALLTPEQVEAMRRQKEMERKKGLID